MANHIAGIDHVIVGVRDLDRARAAWQRLGFSATPRGRHVGWGTANYCLMFEGDYIELLGIVDPGSDTNNLDRFLERREGMMSVALRTTDPDGTRAAWQAAGLDPSDVGDFGRRLEPDTELRFKNVMLAPEAAGGIPMFACAHLTPEGMRTPDWLAHDNGALGLASITVVVDDPATFAEPLGKVFGTSTLTDTDDTLAVHAGGAVLLLVTPDDLDMLHPELEAAVEQEGEAILAALAVRVADLDRTATLLDRASVPYRRSRSGAIGVAPEHTHGVLLEFVGKTGESPSS